MNYFDLEDPADLARLQDPMLALRDLRGLVAIDEIQRMPDIFTVLRTAGDARGGGASGDNGAVISSRRVVLLGEPPDPPVIIPR